MTDLTVTLPLSQDFYRIASSKGEAYSYDILTDDWTPEYVDYLCEYAIGVIVQRCTAGESDKAGGTVESRAAAREKAIAKIRAGEIPTGGFGGGLSKPEKALVAALEAQKFTLLRVETGELTAKGKKRTKAEAPEDAFERFVKMLAEKAGKKVDDKLRKQVRAKLEDSTAYKLEMGQLGEEITLD